jgi:serine/threonine-protein kinase RsbW
VPAEPRLEILSIPSDPNRFQRARAWVTEIAREVGFAPEEVHQLALALSEACANAYWHAYGGKSEGKIDLQVCVEDSCLRLTVRDYGQTFDVSRYRPPRFSELPESGYGIYLMREIMDEVVHTCMDVGTLVEMVKLRGVADSRAAEERRGK